MQQKLVNNRFLSFLCPFPYQIAGLTTSSMTKFYQFPIKNYTKG